MMSKQRLQSLDHLVELLFIRDCDATTNAFQFSTIAHVVTDEGTKTEMSFHARLNHTRDVLLPTWAKKQKDKNTKSSHTGIM